MNSIRYGNQKLLNDVTLDQARDQVAEALGSQGFGILSEIDMQTTLKNKLDVDLHPYRILSACNPTLAWQGIQAERNIGLLLPCNVVLQQVQDGILVSIIDPPAVFGLVDNLAGNAVAKEAGERLAQALEKLDGRLIPRTSS